MDPKINQISRPVADATRVDRLQEQPRFEFQPSAERVHSSSLASQFSRADLANPAQVDGMIKQALEEILSKDLDSRGFRNVDRDAVMSFLSSDPTFRSLAMEYLDKVLQ